MATMTETAKAFFEALDTGKGWDGCSPYCHPNASFSSQAEPLAEMTSLKDYAAWMKGFFTFAPDGHYTLKSLATDAERHNVSIYATFHGTHTGEGGPMPPTGKTTNSDYVYVVQFEGDKISHVTKIWHAVWAMRELGWMP